MIFRSGEFTEVNGRHYHGSRVEVRCALTGEKLGKVFEANTEKGSLLSYETDGTLLAKAEPIALPNGSTVFPLKMLMTYRPFEIIDRETGNVIAKSK